jgi:hypothetical protein
LLQLNALCVFTLALRLLSLDRLGSVRDLRSGQLGSAGLGQLLAWFDQIEKWKTFFSHFIKLIINTNPHYF